MFNSKFTKKDSVAEEIEKIISERWDDDDEDDDVKRADAELRRMKAKPIEADKKTDPDKEIGKLAKKTPKEVDEEVVTEGSGPKEKQHTPYMPFAQRSKEGREIMKQRKAEHEQEKKAKAAAKIGMKEDKWTDIADGPWKKSKRTPGQAASAAANAAGKGLKGAQHKLDVAEPKGKLTAADFKKLRKEESEQIDELSVGKLDAYRKKASVDADRLDKIDARKTQNKLGSVSPEGHKAINRRLGAELADTKIKSKTGTYHPSMLHKIKSKLRKEELEQIDELSKSTLSSYSGKAKKSADKSYSLASNAAQRSKSAADTKQFLKHSEKFGKRTAGMKMATDRLNKEELELNESHYGDMSHAAKELVLHADNHQHLYHSSHVPIMNNLRKKMKKGEYHPEKAKKLWAYHADRAAQSYAKEHGDGKPWHKMFTTADRKAAAAHFEDMHRHELNEGKGPTSDYGLETFATNPTNESTPLNKAKMVAKAALAKVKNEMLGKAGATSEEIDPRIKTTDTLKGRLNGGQKDDVGPGANGKSTKVKFTPGPK